MPGFNDAHVHFLSGARNLQNLELSAETTVDGIFRRVAEFAESHPERNWLLGRGWFYAVFPEGMPHRDLLDRVVADRPIALEAYDSHTTWVNGAALLRLGIADATPDPPRGEIQRDAAGRATGILKETAIELVEHAMPARSSAEDLDCLTQAARRAHQCGLTSVQEAGASLDDFALYDELPSSGRPMVRIRLGQRMAPGYSMADLERRLEECEEVAFPRREDSWISKAFADGVVESGTAAMLAPYDGMKAEQSGAFGHAQWERGELGEAVRVADRRGRQVQIHAIG